MTGNNLLIASFYHFNVNPVSNLFSVFPFIDFYLWWWSLLFCCSIFLPPHFGEKNLKCIQHNSSRLLFIAFNGAYERKGESQYAEFILRAT